MMPRSKDRVALIIAKMKNGKNDEEYSSEKPKGKPSRESEDYSEPSSEAESRTPGLESAADDILRAIRDEDTSALVSALGDFLHIHSSECDECSSEESSGQSEEEDEGDY